MSSHLLKTSLVSMPWGSTVRPNLGIGALVAAIKVKGFLCNSTYPSLTFSTRIGADLYEYFANTPALFGLCEHMFAIDVFGKDALDSDLYLDSFIHEPQFTAFSTSRNPLKILRDDLIPTFIDECTQSILSQDADIIGFSCTFNQVLPSLTIAKRIKALRPQTTVIFGGACVHGKMGEAYASAFPQWIDHIFTGESDFSFVDFLIAIQTGSEISNIPGITVAGELHRLATIVTDMEGLPTPDFDDYFRERSQLINSGCTVAKVQSVPYESSRGCWWGEKNHCTFCGLNNDGIQYRSKSVDKVLAEIVELSQKYHAVNLMAADNILNYRGYSDLLPQLSQLPLDLNLFYEIKANVRRDDVAALAEAGVKWVQPGIESFSDHVLQLMRKGVTALQNIQLLKWMQEYQIRPSFNILVGFTGETDEDYIEMMHMLKVIQHLPAPSGVATLVQVHRFSPFYNSPEAYGILNMRAAKYYQHLIPTNILAPEAYAYFFERDLPEGAAVLKYLEPLNQVIQQWLNTTQQLTARLGAGFIEVEIVDQGIQQTKLLDQLSSLTFVLADQQISLTNLSRLVEKFLPKESHRIKQALNQLSDDGFLIIDSNKALSIVPFSKPHSSRDLENWIDYWINDQASHTQPNNHQITATVI